MRSITWETDDGYTVHMGHTMPYFFRNLTDSLGALAETSRVPRQYGQTTYFTAPGTRTINVTGSMLVYGHAGFSAQTAFDRAKSELCAAFAPHRWGYLTYHTEDGNRRVRCRPVATPGFGERVGTTTTCTLDIEFTTDCPFWESSNEYVYAAGVRVNLLRFPLRLPKTFASIAPRSYIDNPTRETIYPVVEITSTAQLVTVTNETTGKHISVNRPIGDGQKMVVNTRDMSADIWTVGEDGGYSPTEDVSYWLTLDSEPWGLVPGRNVISVVNERPEETPVTYIKYRLPYLGV